MVRRLQAKTPLRISIKTPLFIIQILPKYHPNNIQKSSRNHPDITHISSRYHPHITHISSRYHPHIIQISPTYHPDITHISSRYHPHIIQISSKYHPVNIDFYLVKSRVFTQIWYVVWRWKLHFQTRLKLHFWKAKVEFYSSFTRVSVCWVKSYFHGVAQETLRSLYHLVSLGIQYISNLRPRKWARSVAQIVR